jgi:glycosyltransferase involved in cell wall biosynthesis
VTNKCSYRNLSEDKPRSAIELLKEAEARKKKRTEEGDKFIQEKTTMTHPWKSLKIYFVGELRSPFIKQDLDLLREDFLVMPFDLGRHAVSFKQIPGYLWSVLLKSYEVMTSDIIWIWFADYPAIPFVICSKIFRKPVVVNIGGYEVIADPDIEYGNQIGFLRGAVSRWIIRNSTVCLTMSNAYRDRIQQVVPGAAVSVIPGCIDTSLCEAPLLEKHGVVTAYCDYNKARIIKGISIFEAATEGMDAKVIRNVPHDKLMKEFRKAKVYCQLSRTESFGVALLEAMACGCVPVVSDRDALPEVIGICGIMVPYGDTHATRAGILEASTTDAEQSRRRAAIFSKASRKRMLLDLIYSIV